ncbi:MAG: tRNA epoxyqueuosine(34) reductase QueG [Candidatus Marinimicrobia bacterium]|nr:tRNA epoxyqueuosine(34) reductase QueG [Candidatus Neomarinimicrobiota bacterium]
MDLTQAIKSKAHEIGFNKIGISSPVEPLMYNDYFDNWLDAGKNGTMTWLENRKEERKDVNNYFLGVKTVVSVTMNYFTGSGYEIVANGKQKHKFSNYAWGKDYHIVIKQKLNELLDHIKNELNQDTNGIVSVDSSPVMEKQWAQRGGIGWQGKHTILINNEFGSWIFLGELLLDIPLDYDQPFTKDLCGNCTACIDACPTKALTEYQLDATKCISYLTVEYRSEFETDQKSKLNGWIYGCDICQRVCPWNKTKQKYTDKDSFKSIREIREYSLTDWLKIDEDSFKNIFRDSPIKRIKYDHFMRNVNASSI